MSELLKRRIESSFTGFSSPIFNGRESQDPRQKPLITKESLRGAPFVTIADISEEARLFDLRRRGMHVFSFEEKPDKIVICPPDFEVSKAPIRTGHGGSMSVYKVDTRRGYHRYLISYLGANAFTSEGHGHPPKFPADNLIQEDSSEVSHIEMGETMNRYPLGIYEYYENLFGSFKIHHEPGDEGYWAPDFFRIDPGILHQMEGGPEGAITFITMFNANRYPNELQHIHF